MLSPSSAAETMEPKLSSRSTMSEASFATSVPMPPIATPRSAAIRDGASFTPSPVMAIISPRGALLAGVGGDQGRRVVHAVASHGDYLAARLVGADDAELVFRRHAREHARIRELVRERRVGERVHFLAGKNNVARLPDACVFRDG